MGAGKSTLVSLVIDTLLEKVGSDKGERVIYFYCDRTSRPEELDTPLVILTSLVKQLSYFGTMPIMDAIRETYDKKKNEGHLNEKECLQLIKDLTNQYPLTTIVIDALDEAPLETRTKLLARLSEVITSSSSLVKLFISSRWETDIEATFESSDAEDIRNILEIRPEDNAEDIENFVLHRVESDIRESRLFPGVFRANRDETSEAEERRLTLKHDIVRTLVERSKGM